MSSNAYSSSDPSEEESYESTSNKDSDKKKSENNSSETETQTESDSKPNKIEKKSESNDESDSNNSDKSSDKEQSDSTNSSDKKDTKIEGESTKFPQLKEIDSDISEEESQHHSTTKSSSDSEHDNSKQTSDKDESYSTKQLSAAEDKKSTENSEKSEESNSQKKDSNSISKQETASNSSDSESSKKSSKEKLSKSKSKKSKSLKKKSDSDCSVEEPSKEEDDNKKKVKKEAESNDEDAQAPFDFTVVSKTVPQNLKTDRFGWAIDEDGKAPKETKKSRKLDKVENQKEKERESKWIYMMKKENWKKFYKKNGKYRKVLERRVKKGIPDCLRSKAWHLILDPHAIENPTRKPIDSYYDRGVPSCDYVIRVDIPRTMPRVPMFNRKDVRISLYRVLRSYSNADPELGYYQGMAFSAAILLSYMDETSAFWSFVGLMKGKDHNLRSFYHNSFARLKEINQVWDYILLKKFKDVHYNLKKNNIDHLLYTTSWFLCAFMNINFDTILRLRIFDRFALFGTRALISFGLTIIDMNRTELAKGAFDVIIPILQNPHETAAMKSWRDIIKVYDKDFITKKEFKQYFSKAGVKYK